MAGFRCLCIDRRCTSEVPAPAAGAGPDDGLTFPISISASVGYGGKNVSDDVKIVQKALNRFSSAMGGPDPKLVPDGVMGPNTNDAIIKFQKRQTGWVDGKVEPGKAMINKINELMFTIFEPVDPKIMEKIYSDILPVARRCALAADAALLAARMKLDHPSGRFDVASMQLVNKHFQLDRNRQAGRDLERIRGIFRQMLALMNQNLAGMEQTFIPAPGRFDMRDVLGMRVLAITMPGGIQLPGQIDKAKAQDGTDVVLRRDKVMIMPVYRFATNDLQICTLMHELCHHLGGKEGAPDEIDDPPGRDSSAEAVKKLPPERRPRIAECYSDFAFEAAFHREPIKVIV